ncbi:MAG: hypothetical protein Q4D77_00130 [Peptostreptococcaceae bacterium]|nr:hypothetical protein [Peptostreptococcaceae bacterium]
MFHMDDLPVSLASMFRSAGRKGGSLVPSKVREYKAVPSYPDRILCKM